MYSHETDIDTRILVGQGLSRMDQATPRQASLADFPSAPRLSNGQALGRMFPAPAREPWPFFVFREASLVEGHQIS